MKNMKRSPYILAALLTLTLAGGCFLYNDYEFDNPYDPDRNVSSGEIASAEGLVIDGDTADWDAISPVYVDSEGDLAEGTEMPDGGDLYQIKIAEDANNIYLYISTHGYPPCQTEELHIHVNMNGPEVDEEGHGSHLQIFSMSHDINGSYNTWMGYKNESTSWEWTNIANPQIRFAGMDTDANALEVAIYKGSYLENLEYGTAYELNVDMWYESESRTVDDTDNAPSFVLRPTWQTDPDIDQSVLNLPVLTPVIDGNNEDWASISPWYTDPDETDGYSQYNSDYNEIYLAQDENFIYAFYTFNDSYGSYDTNLNYNLFINRSSGIGTSHNISYDSTFNRWNVSSNHNGTDYFGGGSTAINDSIGMEVRYPKFPGWDDVNLGEVQNFSFNISDSGSYDTDAVNMNLLYKTGSSSTPQKYHAVQYTGMINSIPNQYFYSSDVSAEFTTRAEGATLNFTISGDHGIELETDGSFPITIGDTSGYTTLDTVDDMVWFRHPDNSPNEIEAQAGWPINFDMNTEETLVVDFTIQDAGGTYNINGKLYYYR